MTGVAYHSGYFFVIGFNRVKFL